jgi:hypothetical protein
MNEPTKTCTACQRTLPLTEFYKDARTRDGLMSRCKSCHRESKRASDARHQEQRDAYQAQYCEEHRDELREKAAARRAADPERERETQTKSRAKRREEINRRQRERYRQKRQQEQGGT